MGLIREAAAKVLAAAGGLRAKFCLLKMLGQTTGSLMADITWKVASVLFICRAALKKFGIGVKASGEAGPIISYIRHL